MGRLIPAYEYNRDSVERALSLHVGEGYRGWTPDANGGYHISTSQGILHLRTLREAAIYVHAFAESKHRLQRLQDQDPIGRG